MRRALTCVHNKLNLKEGKITSIRRERSRKTRRWSIKEKREYHEGTMEFRVIMSMQLMAPLSADIDEDCVRASSFSRDSLASISKLTIMKSVDIQRCANIV